MRSALAILALTSLVGCATVVRKAEVTDVEMNPFFREWSTPFGVPPFGDIEEAHFVPAFEEGIKRQRREVETIIGDRNAPTFANTVEALEQSGEFLDRVRSVFYNLTSAETNDEMEAIAKEVAPWLSALRDDIRLDPELFSRIAAVWTERESLDLTPVERRLVEETYKDFVRGGAGIDADGQARLREINSELSLLGLEFANNLRQQTNEYRLIIENHEDLGGLPESVTAAARDAAREAGIEGGWVFTLQAPSIWPFLTYADNRGLRRQLLMAYIERCAHGDEFDNSEGLTRIAALRSEKAKLLGYSTWADYVLEERMAKDPAAVYELLERLWKPAVAKAKEEAETLQSMIDREGGTFELEPWDWRYYAEKVRREEYEVEADEVRQYFALDDVLRGAFEVASRLYGISFHERQDIPVYHPEVRAFEVNDEDGSHLGVFLTDYHPRPGKRVGAWSNRYRAQRIRDGVDIRPIVSNVGNFSRPSGDQPALLTLEEVDTLFHELGHGLHSLLSRIRYQGLARTPRDFVEMPSQILENWVLEPEVLKLYARHVTTGEVIPDELIRKVEASRRFNQGFLTVEYLAAAFLDMGWHTLSAPPTLQPAQFENELLEEIGLIPEIVVRYRSPYFSHIFGGSGSYSAGYYSYIWSEVLDADAFGAFRENGLFDQATARAFRTLLERGGSEDAMKLFVDFRGREPRVEPLLERRGLEGVGP